jgi:ADP-ribosylglycohydrolase
MLGLACGDAVGTTLEFLPPGSFRPIEDMVGGGPFQLKPGQWTDDTSMALCLASSLVECGGFDPDDQMKRYVRWWREGYWSVTGKCFDIGGTCSTALLDFQRTGIPFSGPVHERSAGNGSLMRLAPIPLAFARDPATAVQLAGEMSRTTHGAANCIDACRYMANLILGALRGEAKERLTSPHYEAAAGSWTKQPLAPQIDEIAAGSFRTKQPPAIRGTGFVVHALEAALWAFYHSDNFQAGCLLAANLGDDADTTAAIYGQLAGAYYGEEGIPARWLDKLAMRADIEQLAERLHVLAALPDPIVGP